MKRIKAFVLSIIGFTLLIIGIAMIVLPGPASIVIPAALGILAAEFVWARESLHWVRVRIRRCKDAWQAFRSPRSGSR